MFLHGIFLSKVFEVVIDLIFDPALSVPNTKLIDYTVSV